MANSKKSDSRNFPVVPILTFLGVVTTAFFGYLGIISPKQIEIRATQTAEVRLTEAKFTEAANLPPSNNLSETSVVTEIPTELPTNTLTDIPTNIPTSTHTEIPTDTPTSTPSQTPTNTPTHTPTYTPAPLEIAIFAKKDSWQKTSRIRTYEWSSSTSINPATTDYLNLDYSCNNSDANCESIVLVQFDFNQLPSNAQINTAVLNLFLTEKSGNPALYLQRSQNPWASGEEIYCGQSERTRIGSVSSGWNQWDVTTIVKYLYTNPGLNYGICLIMGEESAYSFVDSIEFSSLEGDLSLRPRLTVNYTP
jgi:hypothetical protein